MNTELINELIANWNRTSTSTIQTYEFDVKERLSHDFIDANKPDAKPDMVYPPLLKLLYE